MRNELPVYIGKARQKLDFRFDRWLRYAGLIIGCILGLMVTIGAIISWVR